MTTMLRDVFGERVREQELMAKHTNLRVGGPARWFVVARSSDEVLSAIGAARTHRKQWCILGGGSNTFVADAGFDGVVIQMAMREVVVEGMTVTAGAGAVSAAVALTAGRAGLSGFEWAISLPGTIGGAVRGNAGCFGGETCDVIREVTVLDTHGDAPCVRSFTRDACGFRYRHSVFKDDPALVILGVTLVCTPSTVAACQKVMDDILERRRQTQPHEKPSAGCLFKNLEVATFTDEQRDQLDRGTGGSWRDVVSDGRLSVGWVIDRLGLKEHRVGNAAISAVHGNFVMNCGGATSADVAAIAEVVQRRAREVFGVAIAWEVQRIGFATSHDAPAYRGDT
ncbi:MAG: UDP-N-acetylmuramate dehydrogenase [bacterium]|nr:UDP-N-acetylmuramate dehydrogenase [bacterium]